MAGYPKRQHDAQSNNDAGRQAVLCIPIYFRPFEIQKGQTNWQDQEDVRLLIVLQGNLVNRYKSWPRDDRGTRNQQAEIYDPSGQERSLRGRPIQFLVMRRPGVVKSIPGIPERPHFLRSSKGHSNMCIHSRKAASDQNVALPKTTNHLFRWVIGIHHHEVGMRIDGFKHTSRGLVKEFLAHI